MSKKKEKFWGSLEQAEDVGREFISPPEKQVVSEIDRRDFLKYMGAGMLLATMACTRRPIEKIIPYVNRPLEVTPGVANWYASTCTGCAASCGVLVKTREGRPIKLEGNTDHPVNQGALCIRGQASLIDLYNPDRLDGPIEMKRDVTQKGQISWAVLDRKIQVKLDEVKARGQSVYVFTGLANSPATSKLIEEFLTVYPGRHVTYDASFPAEILDAFEQSYGSRSLPRYRFDQARTILSFGADFLGTWVSPVEFAKGFSKGRRVESGSMSRFVAIEPALTLTGTNADLYFPVKPGDELLVAYALAHEILVKNALGNGIYHTLLTPYSIENVAAQVGIKAAILKKIAQNLLDHRGSGLIVGGNPGAKNAAALQVVVNLLNSALENDGATLDWSLSPSLVSTSLSELVDLVSEMKKGNVGALFMLDSNAVFSLPRELGFTEALKKVSLFVDFSNQLNETAVLADFVAPQTHFLESWGDRAAYKGVLSLVQPTIAPLMNSRSFEDSLLVWKGATTSFYDYLRNFWQNEIYPKAATGVGFEAFWQEALQKGVVDYRAGDDSKAKLASSRSVGGQALGTLPATIKSQEGFQLSLMPSLQVLDGRFANNGWLYELPHALSKVTWDNTLSISPEAAKDLGVVQGEVVRIEGDGFSLELPIFVQPKLYGKSLMTEVGYGRTVIGRFGEKVGVNTFPAQKLVNQNIVWQGITIHSISKTGIREKLAITQGSFNTHGRPVVRDASYSEFLKDPKAGNEDSTHLMTLWTKHEYKGHRWGMAIDTSLCIGCGVCQIGCQAENNVLVVGKDQVSIGREMSWIRIDRYFKGDTANPEVVYQPMLCQHCENAPCETVCPVLATVHSDEGLNQMIYNRCVGTRYCSNNCPYKVRRFNYFDYAEQIHKPTHLALNPDVTVRSQGVMEKCSFCTQRIREVKDTARTEKRVVKDGEIKTACQQSCPTDAIVFGDINDANSMVLRWQQGPRAYRVLEEVNALPQIAYMTKIRNHEETT
ncbi:MAG: hypothetical protein A3G32_02735 [Deltaproteobacteria bacterium RIFCSPLOWO2_12_FULL_40_28]|nr:MAG: hypothetical protein A3C45_00115 [Deltaproteobacteria bacterium RIFCSPHIGHO2_02_FULL_40_28]OGQ20034.1 MAG: hypothetical protein A3E27_02780 [Deltaproteobacteria bacterium RIFCSPHIGHO2_12_FULL_40_32]OGQ40601.1 MAG: hypothetical protein A3I69_10205 [Deltaproteobacteria bacterium RIFCSPLOWO2_02_FULL_40_36]OGQ54270.1 MAG: hypothetical protein A3G32_02735 [Deltaproteobacteria bacterium RIFCSPLOWO2_12_FULL_40_28]